jgi:hypothetical protein
MLSIVVTAWEQCPEEAGGGICPKQSTCCPSGIEGVSACISGRDRDPAGVAGECCDNLTGCSYGYTCDVMKGGIFHEGDNLQPICRRLDPHPDYLNAPETNRYQMCRLSPYLVRHATKLQGFSIVDNSDSGQPTTYNLGYYSSLGSISDIENQHRFQNVETVLIIVHGSGRTAEDYLCAGLSVIPHSTNVRDVVNDNYHNYLVIAPFFAADVDKRERSEVDNLLYWADKGETVPLGHTWRYGAEAMNGKNVSSYGALDNLIEYLISTNISFPNLKRIVVTGHSAGGQVAHRWALLSSSPTIWDQQTIEVRTVVANPRSYCYLDNRRVLFQNSTNNTAHDPFAIPTQESIESCPSYSQWQWGLEPGGDVVSHYKERILNATDPSFLARKYGSRNVIYLSGELDVIEQQDRCETHTFQGLNRNHRAKNYFKGLKEFFANEKYNNVDFGHEFHQIPLSPHDHVLMYQSDAGRKSLFGQQLDPRNNDVIKRPSLLQRLFDLYHRCKQITLRSESMKLNKGALRVKIAKHEHY